MWKSSHVYWLLHLRVLDKNFYAVFPLRNLERLWEDPVKFSIWYYPKKIPYIKETSHNTYCTIFIAPKLTCLSVCPSTYLHTYLASFFLKQPCSSKPYTPNTEEGKTAGWIYMQGHPCLRSKLQASHGYIMRSHFKEPLLFGLCQIMITHF